MGLYLRFSWIWGIFGGRGCLAAASAASAGDSGVDEVWVFSLTSGCSALGGGAVPASLAASFLAGSASASFGLTGVTPGITRSARTYAMFAMTSSAGSSSIRRAPLDKIKLEVEKLVKASK